MISERPIRGMFSLTNDSSFVLKGSTTFLHYLLRWRLSIAEPTMFSPDLKTVFLFHEKGVYEPLRAPGALLIADATKASGSQLVWSLFDGGDGKCTPPGWLWSGNAFPVQTTSLDRRQYERWIMVSILTPSQLLLRTPTDFDIIGVPFLRNDLANSSS